MAGSKEFKSDNRDTMAIIDKIDTLGERLDGKIGEVHERINAHLKDCRDRHNGASPLKDIDAKLDILETTIVTHLAGTEKAEKKSNRLTDHMFTLVAALIGGSIVWILGRCFG